MQQDVINLGLSPKEWQHIQTALNGVADCEVCDQIRKKIEDAIRDAAAEHDRSMGISGREHDPSGTS